MLIPAFQERYGMNIPGYELVETLGAGGFGTVYRARQLSVRREVALKVDSRSLTSERDQRRFMREVTAAGRLSGHPHVVAVYDAGVLPDGRPYMVLELCPGGSLNDRLRERGPFQPPEVRDIGVNIADALAAAHAAGVLHRDVKPANILVDQYGNPGLADFGLASMPTPGMESSATREALTPAYAPPEAFRLDEPGPAGDVYSLAASLYALLSGRPPHFPPDRQLSIAALMAAQQQPVPDLPGVPTSLTGVLRQAMAFDRNARIPTADAFRDALAGVDMQSPTPLRTVMAPPMTIGGHTTEPAVAPAGQSRGLSQGLILGAAALVGAGILGAGALVAFAPDSGSDSGSDSGKGSGPGKSGTSQQGGGTTPGKGSGNANTAAADKKLYGVETVTANCPAALVPGARARCTRTAECWGGGVWVNGWILSMSRFDCKEPHGRQVFAIALMPPDGETGDRDLLAKNPTVRKVCNKNVLRRSLQGRAAKYRSLRWDVGLIPPSQSRFEQGDRMYRCVGEVPYGKKLIGGVFRPR
ncbi:serine/threonine-protein kinase [Spirillospora sp. NPDC048911]|uniref:serine/threonine-protein kinase n=1 Tax=Spirillospora sp. NPDC048911 TaxID=3364527 RepID=UPI003715F155